VMPGNEAGDKHWVINYDAEWLCSEDADCARMLGGDGEDVIHKCGALIDHGIPVSRDSPEKQDLISYDIVNFNNVANSLLLIFQSLTLEGWVLLMYNFMDSNDYFISVVYFCFMVIFGSFFAMQLVLAQIMDSFAKDQAKKLETVAVEEEKD